MFKNAVNLIEEWTYSAFIISHLFSCKAGIDNSFDEIWQ